LNKRFNEYPQNAYVKNAHYRLMPFRPEKGFSLEKPYRTDGFLPITLFFHKYPAPNGALASR